MMSNLFVGAKYTALYAKFRPTTPQVVVDKIVSYLGEKIQGPFESAIDVGCGSGQSTRILSPYFHHITGTDVSDDQLSEARINPENPENVSFKTSEAEHLPFEDHSTQLITASQCFHWFNQESFFEEAQRILKENGVLALYGYWIPFIQGNNEKDSKKIQELLTRFYTVDMVISWDERRDMIKQRYSGVNLPFRDTVRDDCILVTKDTTLGNYFGHVTSSSSYETFSKTKGAEAAANHLDRLRKDIGKYLPSGPTGDNRVVKVVNQYFLLMGRK